MTDPIRSFIEQMGLIAQAEGGPRIAGQIHGYLLVEGAPRTLTEMTEALHISKASASTNARLLERRGAVRRVSRMGQRQDAYEAIEEPVPGMLELLARQFRQNADRIGDVAGHFPPERESARARVEHFALFYRKSAEFFDEWRAWMEKQYPAAPGREKEGADEQG